MSHYAKYGFTDFVVCCGYKGYVIKEYFVNYLTHNSDLIINLKDGEITKINPIAEPWTITLVDTGDNSQTGGRLKNVSHVFGNDPFCFTYGDGVSDVNITELVNFHMSHGKLATVTAVQPPGRFGSLKISNESLVTDFLEKPVGDNAFINGGFFVLDPKCISLIKSDQTIWEREPMETLATNCQLMSFKHTGFWHPMDTLRDRNYLDDLCQSGEAPWM